MTHTLNSMTASHSWRPHEGMQFTSGGTKIRARIALSLGVVPPKSMLNPHCNRHAHAEFDDSITLLAPPWGSAVHFGGAKIGARIAVSLGAVGPKGMLNLHRDHDAHAEFNDSMTILAPHGCLQFTWGEQRFAPESRSRSELSVQSQC